jgi:hypothetical protein
LTVISPKDLPIPPPPPMGVCTLGLAKLYYERERDRSSTTSPSYPAPAVTPLLHLRDPGHALKNDDHHHRCSVSLWTERSLSSPAEAQPNGGGAGVQWRGGRLPYGLPQQRRGRTEIEWRQRPAEQRAGCLGPSSPAAWSNGGANVGLAYGFPGRRRLCCS